MQRLKPDYDTAVWGISHSLAKLGDYEGAVNECQRASRINPKSAYPLVYEGEIYLIQKQTERAIEEFQAALAKAEIAEAHVELGLAYLQLREFDKAIAELQPMVNIFPRIARYHYLLAKLLEAKGDSEGSTSELQKAQEVEAGIRFNIIDE